jgi:hypothetical protein
MVWSCFFNVFHLKSNNITPLKKKQGLTRNITGWYINITTKQGGAMVTFYKNRELADKLGINLARWKRWSREFLPPDPLAGKQAGYARQYYPHEAFRVYLGGHLVSAMNYTIPEAKKILHDLKEWLEDHHFNGYAKQNTKLKQDLDTIMVAGYHIYIFKNRTHDFYYAIKGVISKQQIDYKGLQVIQELYIEKFLPQGTKENVEFDKDKVKMLNITGFFNNFLKKVVDS